MDKFGDRRTSVTSFKSNSSDSRRNSTDSRRNSAEHNRRSSVSRPEQQIPDQTTESILTIGETPNSTFVESKFCRTGSIQYRNAGWKSSRMRNDSSSSNRSNGSFKKVAGVKESQPNIPVPRLTSEEQKVSVQQKFIEIAAILKDSGVDEDILQKIRHV